MPKRKQINQKSWKAIISASFKILKMFYLLKISRLIMFACFLFLNILSYLFNFYALFGVLIIINILIISFCVLRRLLYLFQALFNKRFSFKQIIIYCKKSAKKIARNIKRNNFTFKFKKEAKIEKKIKAIKNKKSKEIIFPLYFGWEIAIRKVQNLQNHIVGPFKKYWHYMTVVILIITVVSSTMFFKDYSPVKAATYYWTQSSWADGLDEGAYPNHTSNQDNWTKYSAVDNNIATSTDLTLTASSTYSWTQTTDADFDLGSFSTTATSSDSVVLSSAGLAWIYSGVDTEDNVGYFPSIAAIDTNNIFISYQDYTNRDLKFAKTTDGGANWTFFSPDTAGAVGVHTSIAAIDTNNIFISYQYESGSDLKFAKTTDGGANWTLSSPDTEGSVGEYASMAAIDVNNIFISYYDYTNYDLKFAKTTDGGANWTLSSPDTEGYVGQHTSIAAIDTNNIFISYHDPFNTDLKFAKTTDGGANWTISSPDTAGIVGTYTSIVAIDTNNIFISYYDGTNGDLKFAKTTDGGANWTISSPDTAGTVGFYTSIAAIDVNNIFISYYDNTNKAIKFAFSNDGGSIWSTNAVDTTISIGRHTSIVAIDAINIFIAYPDYANGDLKWAHQVDTYNLSGAYTSAIYDTTINPEYITISWASTTPTDTNLVVKVRTCNDDLCSGETAIADCDAINNGDDISSNSCVNDGDQYVQYYATLTTNDNTITPSLDSITINYQDYPASQSLTSSEFNTESNENLLSQIRWNEDASLPDGTAVKFRVRTATSSAGVWTDWYGPTGTGDYFTNSATGCSKVDQTVTCNISDGIVVGDGSNDKWIQYKVWLESDGYNTPTVDDVVMVYVVNAAPEFNADYPTSGAGGVSASSTLANLVSINYSVRDEDTSTGVCVNCVTPSFEYSTDNGENWTDIIIGLSENATTTKTVATSTWNTYAPTWDATSMITDIYSTTTKIRVTVNDGETANNTASASSSVFIIDTKAPVSPNVVIKGGDTYASSTSVALTISASDDDMTDMQMMISNDSGFSVASWENYDISKDWVIESGDGLKTVYIKFKDQYGNESSVGNDTIILDTTAPDVLSYITIRDISNYDTSEYRLFIAWEVISDPGDWLQYNIWRSTDGSDYGSSAYQIIANRATNHILETGLDTDLTYYYKITTQDTKNNISDYSSVISDSPDGQGGTDTTPPEISNVSSSYIYTTQATITWDTDELSNSVVGYSTTAGLFSSETGSVSMADTASGAGQHSIILTNLTPNSIYYYQVQSTDPDSNLSIDNNGGDGYTFTTLSGPAISNVSASYIENERAIITWNTDTSSDSYVVYSENSDLSSSVETGSDNSTTEHSVTISALSAGTIYYYYVKSGVATDNNGSNYYTFTTTSDITAPTISSVSAIAIADTTAIIQWITDEGATSKVEYGKTSGSYTISTTTSSSLNLNHASSLSSLTVHTKYYYHVVSIDANGNSATSTEYNFTTLETLSEESAVVARENAAEANVSTLGGGGILIIDKTDTTAPTITNVRAESIRSDSVVITWNTDEAASSFVEYGLSDSYGKTVGNLNDNLSHSVSLDGLITEAPYHYRAVSIDLSGNKFFAPDKTFTTTSLLSQLENDFYDDEKEVAGIVVNTGEDSKESMLLNAAKKAMDIVGSLASQVSISSLERTLSSQFNSLEQFARVIPAPIMSGEPRVITTSDSAAISWSTDKEANSLVALASAGQYNPSQENPYIQVVGNPEIKTKNHIVVVYNLEPSTTYHYQLRNKSTVGPMAQSKDFTFTTKQESLTIENYAIEKISNEKVIFKWSTNANSDSAVRYTPYRNNILSSADSMVKSDNEKVVIHEITIDNFESGVVYEVELVSKDINNNMAVEKISSFTTAEDDLPPIIYQLQTNSALSPGKELRVQTIISWMTNEPSTTRIYYQKGIIKTEDKFQEQTNIDHNYTKKHIAVLMDFDPGSIYSFMAESIDSGGNISLSKVFTILTPRQTDSVLQVVMKNFESMFGWMGKIRN